MNTVKLTICPECQTQWANGVTCQDHFYQMLYWEAEYPDYGVVHHLMVLSYHMQHPSLYSPETLAGGNQMLADFLLNGVTPAQMREKISAKVDSGKRTHKITGTRDSHGSYTHPVTWMMTAADVVAAGNDAYCDSVRAWARSIYDALQASDNL
ncbi:MAG TPA: DUF5946 family protein [Phototrophicaceae bacterium]|nr:DUF5946 family protein [Phototrophicaceae bacterium]